MLDNETKRRIDTARDILVGKVPDPKSQVEQITIALIYKFMDDMDKEAVSFGGKATFFTGEYSKYSWTKIFDPKLGGHEMLNLYGEAIVKLNINPKIPQLFRDIFKNAYLPYRDPETLKLFLKTINEFTYDHSERLGDAFEYLLSVLGSQGDAGQFRTPRHIIDFIVAILDPRKGETILDPACGTAGFLISAYKRILEQNTKKQKGDLLTPDDRKKMMQNFVGYDISPDMVRLSLVNMYLHGFTTPKIYEYDTLTSEERWNEYYDIVLANPPFMSPKGGIKPHKKFTVQANRSEVLFVDYIAEHINPSTGRAAVIVPNGIVATTQAAYKDLRKMLVQQSLIAVVSLPAGCFNPYSGVKTSVLILDKRLVKKTDNILFVKINNDGFDLGAQRKEIGNTDLPTALQIITEYKISIANNKPLGELASIATLVPKEEILENKDIGLSAERYIKHVATISEFEYKPISDLFLEIKNGKNVEQFDQTGKYRVSRIQTIADGTVDLNKTKWTNDEISENDFLEYGDILLSHINSIEHLAKSAIFKIKNEKVVHGINLLKFRANRDLIIPEYAAIIFKSENFKNDAKIFAKKAINQASLSTSDLKTVEIPVPPLEIQQQIVNEIQNHQKIIDGATQTINNYKPSITINPDWEMVPLAELCEHITKGTTPTSVGFKFEKSGVNFIKIENLTENGDIIMNDIAFISDECNYSLRRSILKSDDILFSIAGTKMGITGFVRKENLPANTNQALAIIRIKDKNKIIPHYLFDFLRSSIIQNEIEKNKTGVAQSNVSLQQVGELIISVPPLSKQFEIVKLIEKEKKLINGNKELIEIFEAKIKNRIAQVWGVKEEVLV